MIDLVDGSTLNLFTSSQNAGQIRLTDSTLALHGPIDTALTSAFSLVRTLVSVRPGGVVDNTDRTIWLSDRLESWELAGGTIRGGSIERIADATLAVRAGDGPDPLESRLESVVVEPTIVMDSGATLALDLGRPLTADVIVGDQGRNIDSRATTLRFESSPNVGARVELLAERSTLVNATETDPLVIGGDVGGFAHQTRIVSEHQPVEIQSGGALAATRENASLTITTPHLINEGIVGSVSGATMVIDAPMKNRGLMHSSFGGRIEIPGDSPLHNDGNSVIEIGRGSDGTLRSDSPITNEGIVVLDGTLFDTVSFSTPNGRFDWSSGLLTAAEIEGEIANDHRGVLRPVRRGDTTRIDGTYAQGPDAVLAIEHGELRSRGPLARLTVTGDVALGGTLFFDPLPSRVPERGDLFEIVRSELGEITGVFDDVLFDVPDAVDAEINVLYGKTVVLVEVVRFDLPGDIDGDDDVDGFDLGLWQEQFGTTAAGKMAADTDGDGDVDAFDLGRWQLGFGTDLRNHLGRSGDDFVPIRRVGSSASIPEPGTAWALVGAGAALLVKRSRRRGGTGCAG